MTPRALVNPLGMLARRLKEGNRIPEEIRDHINEVIRRILIGSSVGFEFDTYAALAHKLLAYCEWCKAMSVLCSIDPKDHRYEEAATLATKWRNAYQSCNVPAPAMARLGALRPSHKGGKAFAAAKAKRAQQTFRARHKDDPNAPLPQTPGATIGRFEPSQDLPPEPTNAGKSWAPPATYDPEEDIEYREGNDDAPIEEEKE